MSDPTRSLDPEDWQDFRVQGHRMLDDMLDYMATVGQRPVWQRAPEASQQVFQTALPERESDLGSAHATFVEHLLPHGIGNSHPAFMGWVHGGGTAVGMLAEMLAAGLNANLGGRDHLPIAVEQQVVAWMRDLFSFPETASGLFVTGSSMANFIGLLVARTAKVGTEVRKTGVQALEERLVAYTSADAHGCIAQAMELSGLGADQLRRIPVDHRHRMRVDLLEEAVAADRQAGHTPFCIVGSAGTVDVGAIDDLAALAAVAHRAGMWFHIDGACGALGQLSPKIAIKLRGIEQADSIALDFHKWGQVPYDAGFVLVRDMQLHQATFASSAAYLRRESRGMAAGAPWPCDFGPDLSRSFKALKVWFTFQVYGRERLAQVMEHTCELAQYLAGLVADSSELELLAPVEMNVVCFRYRCEDADRVNAEIVVALQESGLVAPSSTSIDGAVAIRAAIFNHRTTRAEVECLVQETLRAGRSLMQARYASKAQGAEEHGGDAGADLVGLARIMRHAFHGGDLTPLSSELAARVQANPADASAMLDLAIVLQINGQNDLALELQALALSHQQVYRLRADSHRTSLRLLAIMGPGEIMANTPLEFLVEQSDIQLTQLYLGEGLELPESIPDHDVAFVAVCESDRNQRLLMHLAEVMKRWPRPFINQPARIGKLSRDQVSLAFREARTVVASDARRVDRQALLASSTRHEVDFPLIVRPVDSHAGHGLERIDSTVELQRYLENSAADQYFCAPFVDYRSRDGWYRKYRVVVIDGQTLPAHMAVSRNWMVHYLNADMVGNARNREEEARFMASFDRQFAVQHRAALAEVDQRIGLDYYSIDCAETVDGRLLVFEVDSGAVVHSMDSIELFPYKAPQMQKVFSAFRRLLHRRAGNAAMRRAS